MVAGHGTHSSKGLAGWRKRQPSGGLLPVSPAGLKGNKVPGLPARKDLLFAISSRHNMPGSVAAFKASLFGLHDAEEKLLCGLWLSIYIHETVDSKKGITLGKVLNSMMK